MAELIRVRVRQLFKGRVGHRSRSYFPYLPLQEAFCETLNNGGLGWFENLICSQKPTPVVAAVDQVTLEVCSKGVGCSGIG